MTDVVVRLVVVVVVRTIAVQKPAIYHNMKARVTQVHGFTVCTVWLLEGPEKGNEQKDRDRQTPARDAARNGAKGGRNPRAATARRTTHQSWRAQMTQGDRKSDDTWQSFSETEAERKTKRSKKRREVLWCREILTRKYI